MGRPGAMNPFGMRQNDPEMEKLIQNDFSLDRESRELAAQFQQASKSDREDIKKKLADVVAKQFEARQQRRELELKRLEEEIKRIRERIDKGNSDKKQIVDRRVNQLLGQDDDSF
jgi:chromosome segregation ATPase